MIGRADLKPGLRAAQIGHAVATWVLQYGQPPDNLVLLEVDGMKELVELGLRFAMAGVLVSGFREPDLGHQLTAVAATGVDRLVSSLPLAFR